MTTQILGQATECMQHIDRDTYPPLLHATCSPRVWTQHQLNTYQQTSKQGRSEDFLPDHDLFIGYTTQFCIIHAVAYLCQQKKQAGLSPHRHIISPADNRFLWHMHVFWCWHNYSSRIFAGLGGKQNFSATNSSNDKSSNKYGCALVCCREILHERNHKSENLWQNP